MTVVEPSVSTLASRRTRTPCWLRRYAPMLRNIVSTSKNSSPTADIARLTAYINALPAGAPPSMRRTNSRAETVIATPTIQRTIRAVLRSSGEGLANEEARRAARRDLGNVTLVQENTRAAWGWTLLEQLGQDLRYAFRTMAANQLFTLLAVVSLALGIGANTAIYSFMDAILMRSLPVADPESLVVLNWHVKQTGPDFVMHGMSGNSYDDSSGITAGVFPFSAYTH